MHGPNHALVAGLAVLLAGAGMPPVHGQRANAAPTLALTQRLQSVAEAWRQDALNVADIVVTDDAEGTNTLSLSGADAAVFEIVGTILYLRQAASLDFETNPVLDVTVAVDDPTVGATPDASVPLSVAVTNVNECPANSVPFAPVMLQGAELVFSAASGNAFSASDPDGDITGQISLSAFPGTLRLGSTVGVIEVIGDGTSAVSLRGPLSALNAALNGLTFTPPGAFVGDATVMITTNDMGGIGGPPVYTDNDQVQVTVAADASVPTITEVDSTAADGTYGAGSTLSITVTASKVLLVTGTPQLGLETGAEDALASYIGGSGTATLVFQYVVGASHESPDLDCTDSSALILNGGALRDGAGRNADLTLPAPGSPHSLGANRDLMIHTAPLVEGDPNGHFELLYRDPSSASLRKIWDLSGHYAGSVGAYALTLDLAHDEKGGLTGAGRLQRLAGGPPLDVPNLVFKGKAKGKAGGVTIKASLAGAAGAASAALKLALTLDGAALTLTGAVTGSVTDTTGAKAAIDAPCTLALPAGMDGTYRLPVDLLLDAKGGITGTSTLALANGRTVALLVKGKRSGGVALLQFAGDTLASPAFAAVKLKLTVRAYTNGTADIVATSGKAFGQSLKWP